MEERTVKLNIESNVKDVNQEFEKTSSEIEGSEKALRGLNKEGDKLGKKTVKATQKVTRSLRKTKQEASLAEQNIKNMGKAIDSVGTGFETAEGAMALFGSESEQLEETMKKTQQAMRLTKSIGEIKEMRSAFTNFTKSAVKGLKAVKAGIGATGIGLLVVALGTIAAYWDEITASMGGAAAEGEEILNQSIEQAEIQKTRYEDSVKYENILRAQGKSEKFIRDLQMEELNLAIEKAKVAVANAKQQKNLAIESNKFNQRVLEGILTLMLAPIELLIKAYNKIAQYVPGLKQMGSLATSISTYFFDATETAKEADAEIAKAEKNLKDLENQKAGIILKEKAERAKQYKDKKDKEEKHTKFLKEQADKQKANNLRQFNEYMLAVEQADEERRKARLTDRQRDEEEVEEYYFNLTAQAEHHLANLDKNDKNYLEKKKMLEDQIVKFEKQKNEKLGEIDDEYKQKAIDDETSHQAKIEDLKFFLMEDGRDKEILALEQSYAEKFKLAENDIYLQLKLQKKLDKEKRKIDKKYIMHKAQIAIDGLNLIADIMEANAGEDVERQKKAFNVKKAADIAKATMDGYKAVLSTYAETPGGPVLKGIAAGIAGSFAALQIANIAKQQFKEDGGGGMDNTSPPSGDAGGGVVTPEFNVIGASGVNQLEALNQPPMQAYVVSSEVTTAQGLDRNRVENATI